MAAEDIAGAELSGGTQAPVNQAGYLGPQQASPEEQEVYNQIVANGYNLIYEEGTMPATVEGLAGDDNPVQGLVTVATAIITRVIESAVRAKVQVTADIALHAGTEIFEDLCNLSKQSGIKDYSTDREAMESAYLRTTDGVRMALQDAGILDQASAKADWDKLMQMDGSGELDQIMRGLAEDDAKGQQEEEVANEEADAEPASGGMGAAVKRKAPTPAAEMAEDDEDEDIY